MLDGWKQRGLYVSVNTGGPPTSPKSAVSPKLASNVVLLADSLAEAFDFVLADNLDTYKKMARAIRGTMTERDHEDLESAVAAMHQAVLSQSQ